MSAQGQLTHEGRGMRRCRMAATLVFLASIFACGIANSAIPRADATFAQANQAYTQGDYAGAVRGYRAILDRQGYSVPVLIDLGRAWSRLNQPGRAILSYERALRLAPGDAAITNSLRIVQQQAGFPTPRPTLLDGEIGLVGLDALAWIGIAALLTLCVVALIARSRRPKALPAMRSAAVASALVLIVTCVILIRSGSDLNRAVVLADATPVRIAPAAGADVSYRLKPGTAVKAGSRYEDYVMVRTDDGRSGWASSQQVARIVTRTRDYGPLAAVSVQ